MSDTLRERCLEAGADAMGRSSSWRWWAPRHLAKLFDLWEPMIHADLRAGVSGLPVLHRLVEHDPDCPGRPGFRGFCTCDRQMTELVSVDAVLALLGEERDDD
jgi:hypothetical protein